MNIIESAESRSPVSFHLQHQTLITQIVYELKKNENDYLIWRDREYEITSHFLNRYSTLQNSETFNPYVNPKYFEAHAYGLLMYPHHTSLLVLDIDNPHNDTIEFVKELLMNNLETKTIDIAATSFKDNKPTSWHIYAGLREPHNVISFYEKNISGTCEGFNNLINLKGEIVVRVSQKFYKGIPDSNTKIVWQDGYSRGGRNLWLHYGSEQLIAPLITADVRFWQDHDAAKHRRLRLRG